MNRDDVNWRGYWPASPTPFTVEGAYDAEAHRALLDWYVGEGMHGVFINGTTGEWFSQTADERRLVADRPRRLLGHQLAQEPRECLGLEHEGD